MSGYRVVPASIRHIRPMSKHVRAAACVTLASFGFEPRRALHRAFIASSYCRTALIDDKPIAMWGVQSVLLGDTAFAWLVLSERVTQMPLAVVREARAELAKVMVSKSEIAITVLPDDEAAIRFAVFLGFHDRDNDDGRMSRRDLCEAIRSDPKHRIPLGENYAIALGYHSSFGHA